MNIKVLVLTRKFRGTTVGFGQDFEEKGCIVKTIVSEVECSRWNIFFRIKNRLGISNKRYMERKDRRFAQYIFNVCREFRPDVIYVCHGTQLRIDTIEKLKKECLLVADLIDRLDFFPVLYEAVPHYDLVYTYNRPDADFLSEQGINCKYMPAIGNHRIFMNKKCNKDIDISFIGATYPEKFYGDRMEIINRLIDDFPEAKFFVGGQCAPLRRPEKFFKWVVNRRRRESINNKDITAAESNAIYNRSKICLNINRINTGDGWSERLGNIMFTGAFQLVTYSKSIEKELGDCVETFCDYDELSNKIKYYLSHDDERISKAEAAYRLYLSKVNEISKEINLVDDVINEAKNRKKKVQVF